ncbi:putative 42K protein [Pyrrhocoris apterus virus 1]|nr:putative 42K protein [Pyrrhocoris apterus virus 1]
MHIFKSLLVFLLLINSVLLIQHRVSVQEAEELVKNLKKKNLNRYKNESDYKELIKHSAKIAEFADLFVDHFKSVVPNEVPDSDFISTLLQKVENYILGFFGGATRKILQIILDMVVGKLMDFFGSYQRDIAAATKKLADDVERLKNLQRDIAVSTQNFHQNMWFTNFAFEHIKLPDPVIPYIPVDHTLPDDNPVRQKRGLFNIFGGILDGLAKVVIGIVKPIFMVLIDDVLMPLFKAIFSVLYALIPAVEYVVELLTKLLIYVLDLIVKLLIIIDSKFMILEFTFIFIFVCVRYQQSLVAIVITVLLFLFFGTDRPYPSLVKALFDSLPASIINPHISMVLKVKNVTNMLPTVNFSNTHSFFREL